MNYINDITTDISKLVNSQLEKEVKKVLKMFGFNDDFSSYGKSVNLMNTMKERGYKIIYKNSIDSWNSEFLLYHFDNIVYRFKILINYNLEDNNITIQTIK